MNELYERSRMKDYIGKMLKENNDKLMEGISYVSLKNFKDSGKNMILIC